MVNGKLVIALPRAQKTVVEAVNMDDDGGVLVVSVERTRPIRSRCETGLRRFPAYVLIGLTKIRMEMYFEISG